MCLHLYWSFLRLLISTYLCCMLLQPYITFFHLFIFTLFLSFSNFFLSLSVSESFIYLCSLFSCPFPFYLFLSLSVVASPASSLHFTSMNRCPLGRLIELHWNTFGDKCQSLHHRTCSIFRVGQNNQQSFRVDKPKGKYFLQYLAQTFAALHLRNPLH